MLQYSPKIVTDSLVMCLDASNNKSYPTDLPVKNELVMWLDAADDTTFSYSSGTVVSQWRDKSGLNNHVSQATVANQPSRSTTKNSRKTLVFDGGDTLFNSGNVFPSNTTNYTKIAVVYQTSTATVGNVIGSRSTTSGSNYGHTIYFGGLNFRMWHDTDIVTSNISLSLNTLGIISATYVNSSGLGSVFLNGTASGTGTAANRNIVRDIEIGGLYGGNNFTGEICEALVFSRVLSATELKQIHTYLGQKWGISNTDRSIIDLSNNNYNGSFGGAAGSQTVANMPDYDSYNKGALTFNGSSDEVNFGDVIKLTATQDFTLEVWVNYVPNSTSYVPLLSKEDSPGFGYALKVDETYSYQPYLIITGTTSAYRYANRNINDGVWHHIVGVAKASSTTIDMYVDGVLINGIASLLSWAGTATTNDLRLGKNYGSAFFKGKLSNSKIYNKALSAAEVLQNYEAQKSKFANTIVQQGLVLNLDAGNPYSYAGAGTTFYDVSGAGNDFTIQGNVTWDAINGFSNFDGNSTGSGNKIYRNSFPQNLKTSQGGNGYTIMVVARSTYAGSWRKLIGNGDGENYIDLYQNSTGYTWHQDGSGETLYVDGVQVGNDTYVMYNAGFHFYAATNLNNGLTSNPTYALTIGNEPNSSPNGTNTYPWIGNIAIVLMYNRVLTTTELLQNYNALKGRFGL